MINVIFFGSSAYCLPLIEALLTHFKLKLIITRPDKPIGRNQTLTTSPPKQFAQKHSIPFLTPISLISPTEQGGVIQEIINTHPTIAIVADFGLLIPEEIFTIPAFGTLNIHFSKLPQFRGPSPVQYSILNGEEKAWISFMLIEKGLDTGPIIYQKDFPISSFATTNILYEHLFEETANLLPDVITKYIEGDYKPIPQTLPATSYKLQATQHIAKPDAFIPWDLIQEAIHGNDVEVKKRPTFLQQFEGLWPSVVERAIRAFSPWPEVWTEIKLKVKNQKSKVEEKRLKIKKAYLNSENHLRLLQVQLEGKNPVSWEEFIRGYPEAISSNKH